MIKISMTEIESPSLIPLPSGERVRVRGVLVTVNWSLKFTWDLEIGI
jgi:hypothetical protein